jgi:hypothetical protein
MNQTFQKMTLSLSLFAASLAYAQDQQEGPHVPSTPEEELAIKILKEKGIIKEGEDINNSNSGSLCRSY